MTKLLYCAVVSGAVVLAPLMAIDNARATPYFVIEGASSGNAVDLPSDFNPDIPGDGGTVWSGSPGSGFTSPDGTFIGDVINVFNSSSSNWGLEIVGGPATVTYNFVGAEAAYTNVSNDSFVYNGTSMFGNQPNDNTPLPTKTPQMSGLLPFLFASYGYSPAAVLSNGGGSGDVPNGAYGLGANQDPLEMGFWINPTGTIAFAFLDDGGAGPDFDLDDMVVEMTLSAPTGQGMSTPLPGTLPLFAAGLSAIGLIGRRRRRTNAVLTAAV